MYYTDSPIYTAIISVYTTGDNTTIDALEKLRGKSVLLIRGYEYGGMIKYLQNPANNISLQRAKDHESAFRMLAAGRNVDYLIDYRLPAEEALKKVKVPRVKYTTLKRIGVYFMVPKRYPNAKNIMAKINLGLDQLRQQGVLDEIYDMHGITIEN